MVKLLKGKEPYKMSKRAGNVILMRDIVEEIGSDALRFIFASKKFNPLFKLFIFYFFSFYKFNYLFWFFL